MMEMLWMIEPWHWLVLGFVLLIIEMFVPTFASLWFGAAAIIVAALAWLMPISVSVQVIIWLVLSAAFLVVWFKFVKPLSVDRTKAGLGGSVIVGETGMIIVQPQPDRAGVVRFSVPIVGAAEWMCRTTGEVIAVGERVVVTDIIGNELIVSSMKSQAVINKNMQV
ncbi:NfeD family protein [Psychrobacter vallis]|uniref:NfeD family protein n=1 Tax=Psychrobacter vallis TaxID=248451 RepID=UPI00191828A1|nr:NfeD family protein [Psychrobacter vallis]